MVGYSAVKAAAAAIRKAGSTDHREDRRGAVRASTFDSPFGNVTFRPIDHQSTMGAYVGRTAVKDGKGVMVDWKYADGKDYLPSDDGGASTLRPGGVTRQARDRMRAASADHPDVRSRRSSLQLLNGLAVGVGAVPRRRRA